MYPCGVCSHQSLTDEDLALHKLSIHQSNEESLSNPSRKPTENQAENAESDILKKENVGLKRQLRIMEESYDRLMTMFQKQQSDAKDKALAFKIEIEAATETYRVAKTENEKLKEVNDIQHKLWKIFVNKFEKDESRKNAKQADPNPANEGAAAATPPPVNVEEEEVSDVADDISEIDLETTYDEWLRDTRNRGFKRTSPANVAEFNRRNQERFEQGRRRTNRRRSENLPSSDPPSGDGAGGNQEQAKYCHNWNNLGKCTFENCAFLHQPAPVCKFDGDCRRKKCMFSHVKQNMHFLSNRSAQSHPPMNPWPSMIPPWANPFQFQHNPWQNTDRRNRN